MGLRSNGFYATVWEVKEGSGNYADVRISTSRKDPKDDKKYITDWNGYVRFVGAAKDKAIDLKKGDRIHVTNFEVTNHYDKPKNTTYTNVAVFAVEEAGARTGGNDSVSTSSAATDKDGFMNIPDSVEDEGLPFN